MGAFPVLEVAIGLSFIYLLLALIVTTLTEWVSRLRNGRGRYLEAGIRRLVGDETKGPGLTEEVFQHPLIQTMSQKGSRPSYIPSGVFAQVLADLLRRRPTGLRPDPTGASGGKAGISDSLRGSLTALRNSAGPGGPGSDDGSLPDSEALSLWYDQHMERVSGWYKRHSQTIALIAAIALTVAANADTVSLTRRLWTDSALRSTVVEAANARIALGPPLQTVEYTDPVTPKPTKPVGSAVASSGGTDGGDANHLSGDEQALLGSMMGWSGELPRLRAQGFGRWLLLHLPGWLITALAVSMGAPFWFDTLNRFVNVRSAGRPPQSTSTAKAR